MIQLRPYQREAVDSIFNYYEEHTGNALVSMPVGSGKSVVMAEFIRRTINQWPGERMMLVTHVRELIEQDSRKLNELGVDCGVYSAGLNRRDIHQITVGGIQSIYKRAHECGNVSMVIVDEAHLIGRRSESMYGTFLGDLRKFCPMVKVIGFTATPWRLDSGALVGGLFDDICYHIGIRELIDQGFLSKLTTAPTKRIDTSGVKRQGGEYVFGDLEKAVDKDDITNAALNEVDRLCVERKSILVFCVGVDHASHVTEAIKARGQSAVFVVGDTPSAERKKRIDDFRSGTVRFLVSVGVCTTGLDVSRIDAIVMLRPTLSAGLFIQMIGRATRLHDGKKDALILDFTTNTLTHGPVDLIEVGPRGEPKPASCRICIYCQGLIPPKLKSCPDCGREQGRVCPACSCPMDPGATQCPGCGLETVREPRKPNHKASASDAPILSSQAPLVESAQVTDMHVMRHRKQGSPDSVRVEYWCGLQKYSEWICFDHNGYARDKARSWWRWGTPPCNTDEAISRAAEIAKPREISVKRDGKYWRVISRIY